jgi:hypothetical protein
MASGLTKRLIFAPGPDGKPVVVTVGGHIGAYVVQSIGVGEAVVTGPEGSKTLHPAFNATDINTPSGMVANGSNERNALLELMRNGGTMPAMGNGAFGARSAAASPNAPSVTRAGSPTASPSHATTPGIQP